jgi:hypothetical protein
VRQYGLFLQCVRVCDQQGDSWRTVRLCSLCERNFKWNVRKRLGKLISVRRPLSHILISSRSQTVTARTSQKLLKREAYINVIKQVTETPGWTVDSVIHFTELFREVGCYDTVTTSVTKQIQRTHYINCSGNEDTLRCTREEVGSCRPILFLFRYWQPPMSPVLLVTYRYSWKFPKTFGPQTVNRSTPHQLYLLILVKP